VRKNRFFGGAPTKTTVAGICNVGGIEVYPIKRIRGVHHGSQIQMHALSASEFTKSKILLIRLALIDENG